MAAMRKQVLLLMAAATVLGCKRPTATYTVSAPPPATRPAASTQSLSPTQSTPTAAHVPTNADKLDLLEAVFRHQFDKNASAGQKNVDYCFLSLGRDTEFPPELLARFAGVKPQVLPASLATASAHDGVKHKTLGGRGLIFRVDSIKWLDENTAQVTGGYYEAGLSSSGNTYRVQRIDGTWKVVENRMNWIS